MRIRVKPCSFLPRKGSAALALERLAVRALVDGRAGLMRTDRDGVQRAVCRVGTVVGTLVYRAADCLIAVGFIHENDLLFDFAVSLHGIA